MFRRGVLLALAAILLLTFAGTASARTRSEQKSYTGGLDVAINCASSVGGVCFDLAGNEATAWVVFDDGILPTRGTPDFILWRDIKVDGNYAFIVSEITDSGLQGST